MPISGMDTPRQALDGGSARFPLALVQDAMLWLFIAAGCLVSVEPSPYEILFPLLVFLFLQRYYIQGVMAGSVKG